MPNQYAERNTEQFAKHYAVHVLAMTAEGLHEKSDIAAELAWRDSEIERLTTLAANRLIDVEYLRDAVKEKNRRENEVGAWILDNYGHDAFAKMLRDTSNAKSQVEAR